MSRQNATPHALQSTFLDAEAKPWLHSVPSPTKIFFERFFITELLIFRSHFGEPYWYAYRKYMNFRIINFRRFVLFC